MCFVIKFRGTKKIKSDSYSMGVKETMHWVPIDELDKHRAFPLLRGIWSKTKTAKFNASNQLDEMMRASYFIDHKDFEEKKEHPEAVNRIDHYVIFLKYEDDYLRGIITVLNQKSVRVFYDLTKKRTSMQPAFALRTKVVGRRKMFLTVTYHDTMIVSIKIQY